MNVENKFLNVDELAVYLGVSKNTIYWWTTTKKVPYNKLGRLVRFNLDNINSWLQENSQEVYN